MEARAFPRADLACPGNPARPRGILAVHLNRVAAAAPLAAARQMFARATFPTTNARTNAEWPRADGINGPPGVNRSPDFYLLSRATGVLRPPWRRLSGS